MSYLFDRSLEYSLIVYLRSFVPDEVQILDDDPETPLVTSSIIVSCTRKVKRPLQHGSCEINRYSWGVYIYANSKSERDYLLDAVFDNVEAGIPVVTLENNPVGTLLVSNITASLMTLPTKAVEKLRYRALITFDTIFQEAS